MSLVDVDKVHGTNGDPFLFKEFVRSTWAETLPRYSVLRTYPSYSLSDSLGRIDRGESTLVLDPMILWVR